MANDSDESFFSELKKRKVFQVGTSYLIVGWLIIQIAVSVFPQFEIPTWATRFVILTIATGFPVALVLAWAFELTPDGVKTTRKARLLMEVANSSAFGAIQKRRTRMAVLTGLLIPVFLLGIILGAVALSWLGRAPVASVLPSPSDSLLQPIVAVLPFANMSPDPQNAFFADGVHEDLLTNLSRIGALRVISRTSVNRYRDGNLPLRQIAAELGATHIIEGSVRRVDNRVRVTAQLIASDSDEHLWADRYDRELRDIFSIQSQLADEIARALEARLTQSERASLGDTPTHSVAAYDLYLQARQRMRDLDDNQTRFAEILDLLQRAVEIDPGFANAWSLMAWTRASMVHFELGDPADNRAASLRALERARGLAPNRVETLLAETYYFYHGLKDMPRSLEVVSSAIDKEPGRADLLEARGYILRRMGRLSDGLHSLNRAAELDPLNSGLLNQILIQVRTMGLVHEVYSIAQRLAALNPDHDLLREEFFGYRMIYEPNVEQVIEWSHRQEAAITEVNFTNFELIFTLFSIALMFEDVPRALDLLRFIDMAPKELQSSMRLSFYYSLMRDAEFRGYPNDADRYRKLLAEEHSTVLQSGGQFDNPNYRIWLHTVGMVLSMREGDMNAADGFMNSIYQIYDALDKGMSQAEVRQILVRAEIIRHPERAWELYQREQLQEARGISLELVCIAPADWSELFKHAEFIAELEGSPAHHNLILRTAPFLLP